MQQLKWLDAGNTILQVEIAPNTYRIVEPGNPDWPALSQRDDIAPYIPPTPEEILAAERAAMICTPAQMRLALDDMDASDDATKTMLDVVEGIVAQDRKASIVWEYATQIVRTSPLIEALGTDFTPEQIDDIFRAAMQVST